MILWNYTWFYSCKQNIGSQGVPRRFPLWHEGKILVILFRDFLTKIERKIELCFPTRGKWPTSFWTLVLRGNNNVKCQKKKWSFLNKHLPTREKWSTSPLTLIWKGNNNGTKQKRENWSFPHWCFPTWKSDIGLKRE